MLPSVICDHCNHCRDIDLCRDRNTTYNQQLDKYADTLAFTYSLSLSLTFLSPGQHGIVLIVVVCMIMI